MKFELMDVKIEIIEDRPRGGMWHCGSNNAWIITTHVPTMIKVSQYGRNHYKARNLALTCLEMLVEECDSDRCSYPERMN